MKVIVIQIILCLKYFAITAEAIENGFESFCGDDYYPTVYFGSYIYDGTTFTFLASKSAIEVASKIEVRFDSETSIIYNETASKLVKEPDTVNNIYTFEVLLPIDNSNTQIGKEQIGVSGEQYPHHPPYVTSLKINGVEKCHQPDLEVYSRQNLFPRYYPDAPDKLCGRRKVFTKNLKRPLIVSGSPTRPGLWPWHVALYEAKLNRGSLSYTGGGTLISKFLVLTAAHCVTKNGEPLNPETIRVTLGKHNLFGKDIADQSVEVYDVIVHSEFNHRSLDNDIALLKLRTAAIFNNYVQPACLWFDDIYDHIGSYAVTGTVAGWGFDRTDTLVSTLHTAILPQVPDSTCLYFNPIFYSKVLNGKKFCAGHGNGTTPCNGDSGGGYVTFVSDIKKGDPKYTEEERELTGAWYVKGIVSLTLARDDAAICDPNGYTVFTDVAKYRDWILGYMNRN